MQRLALMSAAAEPRPSRSRPPLRASTSAACYASSTVCRIGATSTPVTSSTRRVTAARNPNSTRGSSQHRSGVPRPAAASSGRRGSPARVRRRRCGRSRGPRPPGPSPGSRPDHHRSPSSGTSRRYAQDCPTSPRQTGTQRWTACSGAGTGGQSATGSLVEFVCRVHPDHSRPPRRGLDILSRAHDGMVDVCLPTASRRATSIDIREGSQNIGVDWCPVVLRPSRWRPGTEVRGQTHPASG